MDMQKIVVKSKVIEKVEIWHSMIAFVVLGMDRIEVSVVLNMFEIMEVLVFVFVS